MRSFTRMTAVTVAASAASMPVSPARAQDALGTGQLLDANTQQNSMGYNAAARMPDFAARNLLITGDVAGGRGFRGSVGYTAPFDFRGATGSDDLFQFRAASALSAPSFILGGSSMDQLRFGQYLNEIEYRRASRAAGPQPFSQRGTQPPVFLDDRIALDRIASTSTTSAVDAGASDLQAVSLLQNDKGERLLIAASSLQGVQTAPLGQVGQIIGLTTFDMARARQDAQLGRSGTQVGATFETTFKGLPPRRQEAQPSGAALLAPETADERLRMAIAPAYQGVLQGIAERATKAQGAAPAPQQLMEDLDKYFAKLREDLATARNQAGAAPARPGPLDAAAAGSGSAGDEDAAAPPVPDLSYVLRHGQRVATLSAEGQGRVNELMKQAEEALRDGEYFWAERVFDRVLRFTPGHPLATAGLGHAQIGAGLYAPAALTLERLFTEHPEMIDVRYDPTLLPSKARQLLAVSKVRELIAGVERDRSLHGFLLAYIGHQLDDRGLVAEGLAAMDPGELRDLLAKIWQ
jgi:hypothetical protein